MTMNKSNQTTWRLPELPTASEVADLVDSGIITKEEAREILFKTGQDNKKEVEALTEEIMFLRKLVDTLANKNSGYSAVWHYYDTYTPTYLKWYKKYEPVMLGYNSVSAEKRDINTSHFSSAQSLTMSTTGTSGVSLSNIRPLSSLN